MARVCAGMPQILTALITLAIGVTTLMPSTGGHSTLLGLDKVAHLLAFAGLVIPMALAQPRRFPLIFALALAYGGLIEIVQPHVGRSAEWADLVADGLGAALGIALALTLRRRLIDDR